MKKIKNDVHLKCPLCGSNMSFMAYKKIGMCSILTYYRCCNCESWEARKDYYDNCLLDVHYDYVGEEKYE